MRKTGGGGWGSTVLGTNKQEGMWTNTGAIQLLMTHTQTHTEVFSRTQSASSLTPCSHNDGSESSPDEGMHLKPRVNPYYMCSVLSVWVRPINYE